mgnify:CR=1 FL=1
MIKAFENLEVWFVTGAQLLYGGETVKIVDGHSKDMVDGLNNSGIIPIKVVYKGTANSSAEVEAVMKAANNDKKCVGIITWMHTFSPAKMWIKGLQALEKPLLHFHTQYNAELPWDTIDMDGQKRNPSGFLFFILNSEIKIKYKELIGMAVLRDDSQPVNFELPDGDVVSLVTWAYILKKLDTELNGTVASLFSINEYLKRINSRVDTWLEEQKESE